jgi:type IV secretion system protein VirB2
MTAFLEAIMHNPIRNKGKLVPLALLSLTALCLAFPQLAAASGGITEFSSPLEQVVNTVTGPAGKWISIVAMALCGVVFIMNKDDISGGFKLLLSVVFGISFIAFATSIVNSVFSFSGAVI